MKHIKENKLAAFAIKKPVTISMILLALMVIGLIAFKTIPIEMMPTGFSPPFLGAWVPYNNANPKEVEEQIAKPIEELVRTIPDISEVSSSSMSNGCWVWVEFHSGTNMNMAYDLLRDRIERARAVMPDDIDRIFIRKFGPDNSSILNIAIAMHKKFDDPYYMVEKKIKTPLERIDGVASIDIYGADEKIIQIELDQNKAKAYNINLFQAVSKLRDDNFTMSSGYVMEGGKKINIRSIGKFKNIEEIQNIPIVGTNIKLKDVAKISFKAPEKTWTQRINGVPSVKLEIAKESMANTVEIAHEVLKMLKTFEEDPALDGLEFQILFSQGNEIEAAIDNLIQSAVWGAIFAVIILFFFLKRIKMTFIVTFSIPISIMVSMISTYFMGWTLNIITMMGFMISVGMVIDNAIVVLENIFRHQANGMESKKAAKMGTGEVALAITLATLTSIVVFLPLFIMKDDVGYFKFYLQRVGTPVIISLLASLLVALVLIPLATAKFPLVKQIKERVIIRKASKIYGRILTWVLEHRLDTALILIGILLFTFGFLANKVQKSDMGGRSQRRVSLRLRLPSNLSISEVSDYFNDIEKTILKKKDYFNTEFIDVSFRKDHGRIYLYLKRDKNKQWYNVIWDGISSIWEDNSLVLQDKNKILKEVQEAIPKKPGVKIRTSWQGGSGSTDGKVSVVINGDDTGRLEKIAEEVERRLALIPDVLSTETSLEEGNDELHLKIDRETARKNGINPNQVAFSLMYTVRGINLPKFQSKEKEIMMKIQLKEEDRENLNQLKNITFVNNVGKALPLSALASISIKKGLGRIRRNNGKTNIEVEATTSKANLQKISIMIDKVMAGINLPFGYSWDKGKRFSRWRRSEQNFGSAIYVAIFFVFLIMGVLFESFILPLSVMISIPLSFFGAYLALYITGNPMDIMASIGFIILIGIVVNNAIVLIDLTNKYRISGMDRKEAILNAGSHRFRPILMTAFTTIAGIMPLALGKANSGDISYGPMGMAIVGGMFASTLLTLLAVPLLYTFMDDLRVFFKNMIYTLKK